jgi:carbamoyl-phosphate synthase small subunit
MKSGKLVLQSGEVFTGYAPVWQTNTTFGEVVFNTGMTGYEETLTDPSYSGQILTFTYPILGNYGVANGHNFESSKIHVPGMICQTVFTTPEHHAQTQTFLEWLQKQNIPILIGVDTRSLTKVIREHGVINGALVFDDNNPKEFPDSMATNWVAQVSASNPETHGNGKYKIILVDCGLKLNILHNLLKFDITVKVVPFDYDYTNEAYDGVFLSNGPGDPKLCVTTINILTKALNGIKPVYGICLGSQLMGLAVGADTYKLKFGHRGQNQPCIDTETKKCYLTSQNHGYAIDEKTIPHDWMVNFRHLNDNTVAGIKHKTKPFVAVQFHPEAAPGPEDTMYFFEQFIESVKQGEC